MAETKEKPRKESKESIEEAKAKVKEAEEALDEQIEVFEPVALAVDRVLTLNGDERTYTQHEMGFLTKLKFFRLLSGVVRMAGEETEGGTSAFLNEIFGSMDPNQPQTESANAMLGGLLRLVELSPDFVEEAYMYALTVPPNEQSWAKAALENLTDEEGLDILEVFVAQNAESVRDFFTKHLARVARRAGQVLNPPQQ